MSLPSCLCLQFGVDRKLSTCAAIFMLRRVAPGHLRLALSDPSIGRRSYMQSDIGKALFLSLKKALEQGMIGDDKDISGKVCLKWKDTEFERQVRSESLIPRGDALHEQTTVSNRNAAEGAFLEQPRSRQTPQEVLILCLGT